jgi:hypothetical protein
MSLINDALQRAKQVQQTQPPASGNPLQFRPVEPGTQRKKTSAVAVFMVLGILLIIGVIFVSRLFPKSHPTPLPVRASTPHVVSPAPAIQAPATPTKAAAPTTNVPAAAITKPPLPKLQAIIFSPARPCAIINGRTLYVGNRIGAFRITAIQPNSVTLVSGTETNVLQLGEE